MSSKAPNPLLFMVSSTATRPSRAAGIPLHVLRGMSPDVEVKYRGTARDGRPVVDLTAERRYLPWRIRVPHPVAFLNLVNTLRRAAFSAVGLVSAS